MNWAKIIAALLSGIGGSIIGVLHASGADKHRTIAGDVAKGMAIAGSVVQAIHDELTVQMGQAEAPPAPDAGNTP